MDIRNEGTMIRQYFVALSLCLPILAVAKPLSIGDVSYPESCTKAEWPRIKAMLIDSARGRSEEELQKIAYTYMCGHGKAATKELLSHSPKKVLSLSAGSGQDTTKEFVQAAEALSPQGGSVWGVELSIIDTRVQITFRPDEACVRSITFIQKAKNWLVNQIEEYCD
jgi:hypothetical protein